MRTDFQKTVICHLSSATCRVSEFDEFYIKIGPNRCPKFGDTMKYSYLCIVNEKGRNLRPNWVTKIAWRAGKCFPGKTQNGVHSAISKIN